LSPRLVAGLLYLQHANDASDEAVVATWLENPECNKALDKQRNEVKRLFRALEEFRRAITRDDELDVMFIGVITFAFIIDRLRLC